MNNIKDALNLFKSGQFLIVTDDEERENEGDLILLGSAATSEKVGFMVRHTSGILCAAMTRTVAERLRLPMMVRKNQDSKRTAFTVSVDAKIGLTTGISAEERANTIRELSSNTAIADDFVRPGHIFPLIAHPEVLAGRDGHTEAGVALAQAVGEYPVAVLSELVNDDGSMMRGSALVKFAHAHKITMISIAELSEYMKDVKIPQETVTPFVWAKLPRENHEWQIATHTTVNGVAHAVMTFGDTTKKGPILTRVHSECLTGDALGSLRCDCGPQLMEALIRIEKAGSGLLIYLRDHEGRGIGLAEKIRAYELQDQGVDTVVANLNLGHQADEREWSDVIEILKRLKISAVRILTNNPLKVHALIDADLSVEIESLVIKPNTHNARYLETKRDQMAHLLPHNNEGGK
jgi:3,4-dihydroxy 2-butanone 4-phosphate synthase / GTP cyclohydrolase II